MSPSHVAPRPTRVASHALHFQMPVLPTPTPPSLLKRQSAGSPTALWASPNTVSRSSSRSATTPLRSPVAPLSPRCASMSKPSGVVAPTHRRTGSAPSSISCSPVLPPLGTARREAQHSHGIRTLVVDEYDAEFSLGMEINA